MGGWRKRRKSKKASLKTRLGKKMTVKKESKGGWKKDRRFKTWGGGCSYGELGGMKKRGGGGRPFLTNGRIKILVYHEKEFKDANNAFLKRKNGSL